MFGTHVEVKKYGIKVTTITCELPEWTFCLEITPVEAKRRRQRRKNGLWLEERIRRVENSCLVENKKQCNIQCPQVRGRGMPSRKNVN